MILLPQMGHLPSNGFISASLAMVAAAPLIAARRSGQLLHKKPPNSTAENHTGSQGVMSIIDITTSHFLHDLICTEVDRVGGTYRRESELSL